MTARFSVESTKKRALIERAYSYFSSSLPAAGLNTFVLK